MADKEVFIAMLERAKITFEVVTRNGYVEIVTDTDTYGITFTFDNDGRLTEIFV